jgi:hypothetical protein
MNPVTIVDATPIQATVVNVVTPSQQPIIGKKRNTSLMIHVMLGLQLLAMLGLGLVFGAYHRNLTFWDRAIDSGRFNIDFRDMFHAVAFFGHLDTSDYDMMLAGVIIFDISAIALLIIYRGKKRWSWLGGFFTVGSALAAGLHMSKLEFDGRDDMPGVAYYVMIAVSFFLSCTFFGKVKVFDLHGFFFRGFCKFIFWFCFNCIIGTYINAAVRYDEHKSFGPTIPMYSGCFSVMFVLGAYAVASEYLAARKEVAH